MSNLEPLSRQVIVLRAGDDLPGFAAIIEDELGAPLNLTDSTAYLWVRGERDGLDYAFDQCYVPNPTAGVVTFDWEGGVTTRLTPGEYQIAVLVQLPAGERVVAPSDRTVFLAVRPGFVATIATIDGDDLVSIDDEEFVTAPATIIDEGDALLTADGQVLRTADNDQMFIRRVP